jgi:lysophospholipase L1-like esterase
MASNRLTRAGLRLRSYGRRGRARGCVLALLLCLLMLASAACAQASTALAGQSGATKSQQQGARQITYVAIGASDSFGLGTDEPYLENWPTDLAGLLGSSHLHLINLGIPGVTVQDVLNLELPIALDSHPDLVTIWLGVNDIVDRVSPDNYASNLNTLLARLRAASPRALIAIANIPDLTVLPYFSGYDPQVLTAQIQAYNMIIASAARRYGAILVDLAQENYNLQAHPEYISGDGLHPNEIGYEQLAKVFYQALKASFNAH